MLNQLRNLDCDRIDLDEAVALSAFARNLRAEYETLGAECPEWVEVQAKVLRREIRARQQDALEKSLREKKSRLTALKPAEERRKELAEEIERLEAKLTAAQ